MSELVGVPTFQDPGAPLNGLTGTRESNTAGSPKRVLLSQLGPAGTRVPGYLFQLYYMYIKYYHNHNNKNHMHINAEEGKKCSDYNYVT